MRAQTVLSFRLPTLLLLACLGACDLGDPERCRLAAHEVLLEGVEQALFRTVDGVVQVQSFQIQGALLTPTLFVFDPDGTALAQRSGTPQKFSLPSDHVFLPDSNASVFVVRKVIELPPETFNTPQGEVTIKRLVPEDRLWFSRSPAAPLLLPLVMCEKCYIKSLGLRAVGRSLVVMWQLSNDDALQLAQLDYDGNVLAQRALDPPPIAGLAFARFRSTPQTDFASVATGESSVWLLNEALQTVRDDLSQYDITAWNESLLVVAERDLQGDLRTTTSAFAEPTVAPGPRYSHDFSPTVAGVSAEGAGVVGYAGNVPYLIAIDAQGKKIGGDLQLGELSSLFPPVDGLLLVRAGSYVLFQQVGSNIERLEVDCQ